MNNITCTVPAMQGNQLCVFSQSVSVNACSPTNEYPFEPRHLFRFVWNFNITCTTVLGTCKPLCSAPMYSDIHLNHCHRSSEADMHHWSTFRLPVRMPFYGRIPFGMWHLYVYTPPPVVQCWKLPITIIYLADLTWSESVLAFASRSTPWPITGYYIVPFRFLLRMISLWKLIIKQIIWLSMSKVWSISNSKIYSQ